MKRITEPTNQQLYALLRVCKRWGICYTHVRMHRRLCWFDPMFGVLFVQVPGMMLGIEWDGYVHS